MGWNLKHGNEESCEQNIFRLGSPVQADQHDSVDIPAITSYHMYQAFNVWYFTTTEAEAVLSDGTKQKNNTR